MKRNILIGVIGVCALAALLLSKRASSTTAVRNEDLRRWEDDGGYLPQAGPHEGNQPAVTVDIHST